MNGFAKVLVASRLVSHDSLYAHWSEPKHRQTRHRWHDHNRRQDHIADELIFDHCDNRKDRLPLPAQRINEIRFGSPTKGVDVNLPNLVKVRRRFQP